jgi:hypothetical protein
MLKREIVDTRAFRPGAPAAAADAAVMVAAPSLNNRTIFLPLEPYHYTIIGSMPSLSTIKSTDELLAAMQTALPHQPSWFAEIAAHAARSPLLIRYLYLANENDNNSSAFNLSSPYIAPFHCVIRHTSLGSDMKEALMPVYHIRSTGELCAHVSLQLRPIDLHGWTLLHDDSVVSFDNNTNINPLQDTELDFGLPWLGDDDGDGFWYRSRTAREIKPDSHRYIFNVSMDDSKQMIPTHLFKVTPSTVTFSSEQSDGVCGRKRVREAQSEESEVSSSAAATTATATADVPSSKRHKSDIAASGASAAVTATNAVAASASQEATPSRTVPIAVVESILDNFQCVVCSDTIYKCTVLQCSHSFCETCVDTWFQKKKKKQCPMCRQTHRGEIHHNNAIDEVINTIVQHVYDADKLNVWNERKAKDDQLLRAAQQKRDEKKNRAEINKQRTIEANRRYSGIVITSRIMQMYETEMAAPAAVAAAATTPAASSSRRGRRVATNN